MNAHRLTLVALSVSLAACQPTKPTTEEALARDGYHIAPLRFASLEPVERLQDPRLTFEYLLEQDLKAHPPLQDSPELYEPVLWNAITAQFSMVDIQQRQTQYYIKRIIQAPKHLEVMSERADPYLYFIFDEIKKRNMPAELAILPMVESAFHPHAYSHARAAGLWQFTPATAQVFGLNRDWWYDGRKDVYASTHAALDYLQQLNKRYKGDWLLALAAYNAGMGNVDKAIRKNKRRGKPTDFWHLPLPKETRHYVPKLLAYCHVIQHAQDYNINLYPVVNDKFIEVVELDRQIEMALLAEMSGISEDEIYQLNPGFKRWATMPDQRVKVVLPINTVGTVEDKLKQTPATDWVKYKIYRVKSGDSLSRIAHKFGTQVSVLQRMNNIKGHLIRLNQELVIPLSDRVGDTKVADIPKPSSKPSLPSKTFIHTVADGDTLWDIARQYDVRVKDIKRWNSAARKKHLKLGSQLTIKRPGHLSEMWIKPDDMELEDIAHQYQVSAKKIRQWNLLSKSADLSKVSKLRLWLPNKEFIYTIKNGDTLWDIAKAFNLSVTRLTEYNQLSPKDFLQPGQSLKVPVEL